MPLLKDVFATERKRAKTLNFSIAYGKTAMGLSKDWGVSLQEAKDTLHRWYDPSSLSYALVCPDWTNLMRFLSTFRYSDRPEVLEWQENTIRMARKTGYTKTLMGRCVAIGHMRNHRSHATHFSVVTVIHPVLIRYRPLADINHSKPMMRGHAERAAINTPIQVRSSIHLIGRRAQQLRTKVR